MAEEIRVYTREELDALPSTYRVAVPRDGDVFIPRATLDRLVLSARAGLADSAYTDCKNRHCQFIANQVATLEATMLQWKERAERGEADSELLDAVERGAWSLDNLNDVSARRVWAGSRILAEAVTYRAALRAAIDGERRTPAHQVPKE